jgi:hypothetical protein
MTSRWLRTTGGVLLTAMAVLALPGDVLGHTSGAGATLDHVLLEVAEWGLGVAVLLAVIVLVFWVRARGREE